jgi:membrane fusion protein, copper/silver efflux system
MSTPTKVAAALCLAVLAFFAGKVSSRGPAASSHASGNSSRAIVKWVCPMHPQFTSDRPGNAPCCGMRLEPVYSDSPGGLPESALRDGQVVISARQQQLLGVRTGEVMAAPVAHVLRVPGRVTPDEARVYRMIAVSDGWIRYLGENSAGAFVKKDDILASYYVPSLISAQQAALFTLRATNTTTADLQAGTQQPAAIAPTSLALQSAIDSLRSLGMTDRQMDEFRRTRTVSQAVHIYAPVDGYVLARNISPGQRFERGTELFRVADVSRLWVLADLFENDRALLRPGAAAVVRYQGREFPARMSDALPQIDPQTRSLKTRFELSNSGNVLRPEAFVNVEIELRLPASIAVPADAVIDSGRQKTVFVAKGNGVFEPRSVETGWRIGDRVQITKGLEAGESIVMSGNFLIDSESRMRMAVAAAPPAPAAVVKDPVCGMDVGPKAAGTLSSRAGQTTYYFCSDSCKKSFEANPAKYGAKIDAPRRGTE